MEYLLNPQLGGILISGLTVVAAALFTDSNEDRADIEELSMTFGEAYAAANEGSADTMILCQSTTENSDLLISALREVGIRAEVQSNVFISVDLREYLHSLTTEEENGLFIDLIACGLLMSPGARVGTYRIIRAHRELSIVSDICSRFKRFIDIRNGGLKFGQEPNSPTAGISRKDLVEGPSQTEGASSPDGEHVNATVQRKVRTALKTIGKSRKRKASSVDDTESEQADDVLMLVTAAASSAARTPSARRKTVGADPDLTGTAKTGRRRKAE